MANTTATTYDPRVTPWDIWEPAFATLRTPGLRGQFLLRYALLAPSGHNTQPWRFQLQPGSIHFYADFGRRLPLVDPGDRELIMSVGAAIMNLRVAAAHFGYGCRIEYVAGEENELLASASLAENGPMDPALAQLFPAITLRRTNRLPFWPQPLHEEELGALRAIGVGNTAGIQLIVDAEALACVATLIAEGDRVQLGNPALRQELASLVHPERGPQADGSGGDGYEVSDLLYWDSPWFAPSLDLSKIQARRDHQRATRAAALAVIHGEDVRDSLLEAGELYERLALTATMLGLEHSVLNQPIQVRHLRPRLRDVLGLRSWPQLIVRLGHGERVARPTPRRPLETVIL